MPHVGTSCVSLRDTLCTPLRISCIPLGDILCTPLGYAAYPLGIPCVPCRILQKLLNIMLSLLKYTFVLSQGRTPSLSRLLMTSSTLSASTSPRLRATAKSPSCAIFFPTDGSSSNLRVIKTCLKTAETLRSNSHVTSAHDIIKFSSTQVIHKDTVKNWEMLL